MPFIPIDINICQTSAVPLNSPKLIIFNAIVRSNQNRQIIISANPDIIDEAVCGK